MTEMWPVYGYDPGHTGHGTDVTPPDGPVHQRWVHDLDGKYAYGPPVVSSARSGTVLVHSPMTQVPAPNVRAVDAADGTLAWALRTPADYGVESPPTLAEDHEPQLAVIPGGWAVETRTGGRTWERSAIFDERTTVVDGLVHFGYAALDLETGETRWMAEFERPVWRAIGSSGETQELQRGPMLGAAAIVDGTVFASGRLREGTVRFDDSNQPGEYDEWGGLYALDARDGSVRWGTEFETTVYESTPTVVQDGVVYVVDRDATLRAFDAEDGHERWQIRSDAERPVHPAVANGRVFFRGQSNVLHAIASRDGAGEWRCDLDGSIAGAPAVVDRTIYLATTNGSIVAVDADEGSVRWKSAVEDQLGNGPIVADGRLYVAGYDLHCLEPRA